MIQRYGFVLVFAVAACAWWSQDAHAQLRFGAQTSSSSDLYNGLPSWQGGNWLGSSLVPTQDWRLGVQVDNLDTGVYIRQVAPNSAASRANLEVGDLVIAVAGQQVGIVDSRPIDMGTEIKRRADVGGNVTLLVQDSRSGRLASIRVRLDSNQTTLRGQVVRRDRSALPADAQLIVTIENVSRKYYAVRNGESVSYVTGQANIPFEINFDPAYIDPNDNYEVRARIISGTRQLYDTPQPVRVFGNNPVDNVVIEIAPYQAVSSVSNSSVISAGYSSSDALVNQYRQVFRRYINREPSEIELAGLLLSPTAASDLENLPITLLASQQYYDAVGNNNALWVTSVFQKIIGRPPTTQEHDQWLKYFADLRGSRVELLRQLYRSRR
jgi:uncharacterized lipoprotein YbaY